MNPTNDRRLALSRSGAGLPPVRYTGPALTWGGFPRVGFTELALVKLVVVEYDVVCIPVLDLARSCVIVVEIPVVRVTVRRVTILRTTVVEYTSAGCFLREYVMLKYLQEEYTPHGYNWAECTALASAVAWRAW